MKKKEISEQIGRINLQVLTLKKETDKIEIYLKRKKLEIKKLTNKKVALELEIQELDIANWKAKKLEKKNLYKINSKLEKIIKDKNDDYYSQNDKTADNDDLFINYIEKNIVPYND